MLSKNEELESLRSPSDIASLEILKSPKFWTVQTETQNSWRSSHGKGDAVGTAKFFDLIHPNFGTLKVQKLSNNAALPKRSTDQEQLGTILCAAHDCTHTSGRQGTSKDGIVNLVPRPVSMLVLLPGQALPSRNSLM